MKRLIEYTKKYYIHMIAATLASVGAAVSAVFVIDLLRYTIDLIAKGNLQKELWVIMWRALGIIVIGMFCNYMVVAMTGYIGSGLLKDLRNDSLASLSNASPNFVEKNNFGDVMEKMSSDVETIAGFMQGYFKDCLYVPIMVIVYATYLLKINLLFAFVCLFPLVILVPISVKWLKPVKLRQAEYVKELGMTNNNIQEAFDGVEVIKSYNLQGKMEEKYYKALKKTYDISNDTDLRQYNIIPVSIMIREVPLAIALCFGGFQVFEGNITISILIAFISVIKNLIGPLSDAYQLVVRSQTAMVSIGRVFSIIDMPPELSDLKEGNMEERTDEELRFENVSFSYGIVDKDENVKAIENVSFTIRKGTKTALVGRSGGGKSTILKLISRHLEVDEGNIVYCGVSYKNTSPTQIREKMALISQDAVLFPMTIIDNIKIGNPDATLEQVMKAAKMAKCEEFVNEMPQGMYSVLEEKGNNLSGGQRQRLAIARALVKDASILLLDEPTSALDKVTEEHISQTIDEIAYGRTVITVAHKLSTIKDYDKIIVIDEGRIAEQGSHEELMEKRGKYYEMYQEYERIGGGVA